MAMKILRLRTLVSLCTLTLLFSASSAHAHILSSETGGFKSGFLHPWSGWDHIIAMVAVGIWGAQIGRPAIWLLPVVFPMVMAFGGFLGLLGVPMPGGEHSVEIGIALSGILLGLMVLGDVHPNRLASLLFSKDAPATAARKGKNLGYTLAVVMVGFFGLCHGYAHGTELPPGESGLYYSIGFVIATGTLHACGISIGLIHRWPAGQILLRLCGMGIALGGLYFMWGALHAEAEGAPKPKSAEVHVTPVDSLNRNA
jgi:urease accessory protein